MTENLTPASKWNHRYGGTDEFIFGTEPNDFVAASVADLPPGDVLCLADGEGRNGVFLAEQGHRVTSVDLSSAGLAKAQQLAAERGVAITTIEADLGTFDLGEDRWDLVVSVFAHVPPEIRARVHNALQNALRPNGLLVLESYHPDQIGRGTGGPKDPKLTMTVAGLRSELTGLTLEHAEEFTRSVIEGSGHTGDAVVTQVIARNAG